jgi:hypothetical protein
VGRARQRRDEEYNAAPRNDLPPVNLIASLVVVLRAGPNDVKEGTMRRVVVAAAAALAMGVTAGPASADVHGVSQAGCAPDGVPSGATAAASRAAPGRPDAPIPVTASDGRTQGMGGDADAQGANC